jgi:hypothetical protein
MTRVAPPITTKAMTATTKCADNNPRRRRRVDIDERIIEQVPSDATQKGLLGP